MIEIGTQDFYVLESGQVALIFPFHDIIVSLSIGNKGVKVAENVHSVVQIVDSLVPHRTISSDNA